MLAPAGVNARGILSCKVGNGKPVVLCSLEDTLLEFVYLQLIFDQYTEFTVEGPSVIHLFWLLHPRRCRSV
jgi:hypothetical protein